MVKRRANWTFYWAYGSNLNKEQMKRRCPRSLPLGKLYVDGGELVFRNVADVRALDGGMVPGGLWYCPPEDIRALDRYAGVDGGFYSRRWMVADHRGETIDILWYKMNSKGIYPPGEFYFNAILQGYKDFGLDTELLFDALEFSWNKQKKTLDLAERIRRKGKIELAQYKAELREEHRSVA